MTLIKKPWVLLRSVRKPARLQAILVTGAWCSTSWRQNVRMQCIAINDTLKCCYFAAANVKEKLLRRLKPAQLWRVYRTPRFHAPLTPKLKTAKQKIDIRIRNVNRSEANIPSSL